MMQDHVRIAAVLRIVYSLVQVVGAAFAFLVLGVPFAFLFGADAEAAALPAGIIGGFVAVVASLAALCALPGLLAGWGMLKLYPWARILNIVLSFFDLFAFPMGTLLGVYSLWALFHPEAIRLFEPGRARPLYP